jgi:hypothetical protein
MGLTIVMLIDIFFCYPYSMDNVTPFQSEQEKGNSQMLTWTSTTEGLLCKATPHWALVTERQNRRGWLATVRSTGDHWAVSIFRDAQAAKEWCEGRLRSLMSESL